tara:strand:- start:20448 stop:20648 length:201 start_codon:yes stop_codon:yes gene_type:complete
MKTLATLLTTLGIFTLSSCKQDTEVNNMMHNNGDYHYGGMHMGWWFFALVIVILIIVLFMNFQKRK